MSLLIPLAWVAAIVACNEQHQAAPPITSADYNKGASYLHRLNDSAYYYFNRAATNSKDSLKMAMAYNNMAVIQRDEGDYYGAQETALISLKYIHQDRDSEQNCLVANYNVLGSISQRLGNYDAAINYYDRALPLIKSPGYKAIALNNKAFAFQKEGHYIEAIAIYDSILPASKKSKKEYARALTNLAMTRWLQDSTYQAAPGLLLALQLRKAEKDEWGLNSSYAHLSDYYLTSHPDSALNYSRDMYAIATQLQSPDDQLEALQKLIRLSPANETKGYFIRYQHLNDSLQTARNAAKNQFALIRYEAEKNKTDNLRLQQENAQKKLQLIRQRIILYSSIFGFLLLSGILFWANRTRLRRYQLRTSTKVHDVVANGLYRLMSEIEHGERLDKGRLLDQLEELYERSRDISYDLPETDDQHFQQSINRLLGSFSGPATRVVITGSEKELWNKLTNHLKNELKPILQEIMINMQKHSHARNVVVKFDDEGDQLKIRYSDDGIGFPPDLQYGNGLTNTGNRIKAIGGRINFASNTPKGLKIEIRLPFT